MRSRLAAPCPLPLGCFACLGTARCKEGAYVAGTSQEAAFLKHSSAFFGWIYGIRPLIPPIEHKRPTYQNVLCGKKMLPFEVLDFSGVADFFSSFPRKPSVAV